MSGLRVCSHHEHSAILTAFNGKETFRRIKRENAQIAFACDDHIAPALRSVHNQMQTNGVHVCRVCR